MARTLVTIFAFLTILAVGSGASYWVYERQHSELLSVADRQLSVARGAFKRELSRLFDPATGLYTTLAAARLPDLPAKEAEELFFAISTGPVRHGRQLSGVFLGFPDGRFMHVQDLVPASGSGFAGGMSRRVIDDPVRHPEGKWYQPIGISGRWRVSEVPSTPYDPRVRPWYKAALASGDGIWTDPYVFASSGSLGVTYARTLYQDDGSVWAIMGVDLSLETLSLTLTQAAEALTGFDELIFATDLTGRMVGHPALVENSSENIRDVRGFLDRYSGKGSIERALIQTLAKPGTVMRVAAGGKDYLATMAVLNPDEAMPLSIYLAHDLDDVLQEAHQTLLRNVGLVFIGIVAFGTVSFYVVKLGVEVTARKKAEAELVEARDMAEEATRAKSAFLATMSHEIRTPMNGVMSMAELLSLSKLDGEQAGMARVIRDSASALLTIINDILDFSKIEAGKLDIETVPFSLMEVVDGAAEIVAQRAEEKGIALLVEIDPELADRRLGDPTRLRQILLNLAGNAVKFTERGEVRIRVTARSEHEAGRLRFDVVDTGIGLSPEQCALLFQPFVQADQSTARKFGGTGLGLSICHRLTELMGGEIGVTSVPGEGSTFWCELSLAERAPEPPRPAQDLSTARVVLFGLGAAEAEIAERYLRAGGISDILQHGNVGEEPAPGDLVLAGVYVAPEDARRLCRPEGTIVICGGREDLSALSTDHKAGAAMLLAKPFTRPKLWRAAAIALGRVAPDAVDAEARPDLDFAPPPVEEAREATALVLVAEDNPTNQTVIHKMLARMGYAVEIAPDGRQALELLERGGHGLLLTDINMPEMDGFTLAGAVREREARGGTRLPIVALTADAMSETEERCLAAGMDACLTKPIDSRQLGQVLAAYVPQGQELRRSGEAQNTKDASRPARWDREIFDPTAVEEAFGDLNDEAKAFVLSARDSWTGKLAEISAGVAAGDIITARNAAHSLKGAALSVGALRLGRLAGSLQEALDEEDEAMTGIMVEILPPTLEEFDTTIKGIF